jgi:hypothetical protein
MKLLSITSSAPGREGVMLLTARGFPGTAIAEELLRLKASPLTVLHPSELDLWLPW